MTTYDKGRAIFWGLLAFLAFGSLFFLAVVAWLAAVWRRERARLREDKKRWAMDPSRHGPLTWGPAVRRLRR
jgi:hypothetical protein